MNTELTQHITVASIETLNHRTIKAIASIRIGTLIVHKLRVIQRSDGNLWVALPKDEKEENGAKVYTPFVEVKDRSLMKAIEYVVLDAYKHETSPQQILDLFGCGNVTPISKGRPKKANSKYAGKNVYGETYLPDEDISDVGA